MRLVVGLGIVVAVLLPLLAPLGQAGSSSTTTHPSTDSRLELAFLQPPMVGQPVDVQLTIHPSRDLPGAWVGLSAPEILNVTPETGLQADFEQGVPRTFTWQILASEPVAVRLVAFLSQESSEDSVEQSVFFGVDGGIADLHAFLREDPGLQGTLTAHVEGEDLVVRATYATQPRGWQSVSEVELKLRERQGGETVQEPITYGAADEPTSNTLRIPLQPGQRTYTIEVEYQVKVIGHAAYVSWRTIAVETIDLCNAPLTISLDALGQVDSPCRDGLLPASEAPASGAPGTAAWLVGVVCLLVALGKHKAQP